METAYLHIVTNHIPIIGVPLALGVLILGIYRKSDDLKATAFLILIVLGCSTVATFLLGLGGEDFVEDIKGVSKGAIGEHEEFAKFSLASVAVTASLSLFAILRYRGVSFLRRRITTNERPVDGEVSTVSNSHFPAGITFAVLFMALVSGGLLGYTGKLGGKIRHTEFYGGAENTDEDQGEERNRDGRHAGTLEPESPSTGNSAVANGSTAPEKETSGRNRRGRSGGR